MAETTLATQINALATRIGQECKSLNTKTTSIQTELGTIKDQIASATNIDDTKSSTTTTYSSSKISSEITAAKQAVKNDLLGGAGAAYDTLKELGDLIDTNKDSITALQALAAGHVKYDGEQTLTDEYKTQARSNIGAGSATELATVKSTADAAKTTADTAQTTADTAKSTAETAKNNAASNLVALNAFKAAVGDTTIDFTVAFEAALEAA